MIALMSIGLCFPKVFTLAPDVLDWGAPFSWARPNLKLLDKLWAIQVARMEHLQDFWTWTDAMIIDLKVARAAAAADKQRDAIDCARFITCMPALHATLVSGQIGSCFDWIWTAISPTHNHKQRVNKNIVTFANFPNAPAPLLNYYRTHIPQFASACFYVAYKLGGLDALTSSIAPGCWYFTSICYRRDPQDDATLEAMVQMVIWAAYCDWPEGQNWARELLAAGRQTRSLRQKLQVAMTFTTPANCFVAGTPQDWAAIALQDCREVMAQHERLQAYAVALTGPEQWSAYRSEILAEITQLRAEYMAASRLGESDLEVLEQRVSVIHPLVFALLHWGKIDDLAEVLAAWYRSGVADPADANLLAVVPNCNGGVAYLWPSGRWLTGAGDSATYDSVQRIAGTALGSYFRGTDGDHAPSTYNDFRFDVVDTSAGYALESAMLAHFRFEELKERLPAGWTPRATLIFPSGPEPVQALLAKVTGLASPLEISFQRACARRPIRNVAVWAGGPWHERFELEAIQHVAARVGWTVSVSKHDSPTSQNLRDFYENEDADVVWVISHGTHDPFDECLTGIHLMDAAVLIDLNELRSWRVSGDKRRLLVLNSCSGAATQSRGGLARIGLAHSLVSSRQSVVGHLWPVHWATGLAFGAALAACLEDDPTEKAALKAAKLLRDPELLPFLEDRFCGCNDLLDRLRRSGEDLASLTNWGCPVLLS